MPRRILSSYHYVRLAVSPPSSDALVIRKAIQDALGQSFGLVNSHTYLDILWQSEEGAEIVIRIGENDAPKLLAAVTAATNLPRLSLIKESTFLPALLSVQGSS